MKIQKQTFSGGVFERNSFVLHKITGRFTGKCSAWFLADGSIYDAEWIRNDGQIRNIPRNSPMFRHCESLGPIWK
jgi:hypothetical protein